MDNIFTANSNGTSIYNSLPETVKYFQEVNIIENIEIPCNKPDIEAVSSLLVSPKVLSSRLITTPIALSYEGQNLTGYKLIVDLQVNEKLKYVAALCHQPIHGVHFSDINKSVFVVVPEEINGIRVCDLIRKHKYAVTPYVTEVYTTKRDCRTFYSCVSLLVDVRFFV